MRETRLYGSEGGEAKAFPTPIIFQKTKLLQEIQIIFLNLHDFLNYQG